VSDALALSWLDRLLDLDDAAREVMLRELATGDPPLHARLVRLLSSVVADDNSLVLARPILEGLRAVRHSATVELQAEQIFAGYRLLRELGRGGMSVVWLAERADGIVRRQVALKLPLISLASPIEVERFAREKDVLASSSHPHIARLYDAGVAPSGQPFIVLEFVDGMPIGVYCDALRLDIFDRLRLFRQVLTAVDHAHKHLIVHRDLKPSNILVDKQGQVKLLDFGLAKLLTDPLTGGAGSALTQQGGAAMTPQYAAPEQVNGGLISTATDIYTLGVVLHELMTGVLPYNNIAGERASLAQVLGALLRGNPTLPSQATIHPDAATARAVPSPPRLRTLLSGDIDTMVSKAMRFEAAQRYSSVERFAEDVRCFLDHRPISARPPGSWYSARLFLRRHRGASLAAGIGAVFFLTAAAVALQQYQHSRANASRVAAVRDFMFDLVDDAEPTESQPNAEVTGKQMIDGAIVRAHRDFASQPQLQGELLSELGRMYARLDQTDEAQRTLTEALQLLQQNAQSTDSALNRTRAQLADLLLDQGDIARARRLASEAHNSCAGQNTPCAKVRAYSEVTLSKISSIEGRADDALAAVREAARETALGFGAQNAETAMSLVNLSVMARNTGHLREAGAAIDRALAVAASQTLRSADRSKLTRTAAVLDLDMGRYESARSRLTQLLRDTKNVAEHGLQLRLLANTLLALGDPAAALETAQSAIDLANPQQVGAEVFFARQAHAQAQALLGRSGEGLNELQVVIDGLRGVGRSDDAPEVLRVHRIRGELLLRAGQPEVALRELELLSDRLSAAPESRSLELGQTLDLMGCALRELNRLNEAIVSHDAARMQLRKQLPDVHPFLVRNLLYRERATGDQREFLRDAAQAKNGFAPTSIWRRVIDAQLDATVCRANDSPTCVFVL
jgi:serine/threonine protein kinase